MSKPLLATPAHVMSACGIGSLRGLRVRVHVRVSVLCCGHVYVCVHVRDAFKRSEGVD